MPLYEYECDTCGRRFERIQKFSDPPVDVCPNCGARTVRKLMASPAIQFKGTGWYITDYAKKDGAGAGKSGSKEKSDGEQSAETKKAGEAKSDAAATTTSTTETKKD